jgi:hypothetical protein
VPGFSRLLRENISMQSCSYCRGQKVVQNGSGNSQYCPMCEGTGVHFDPGREFSYEMGPVTLNAPAALPATNPQNFAGAASAGPVMGGVSVQVVNFPFRWMFALAQSTFPFTVQMRDAGSGSGRSFSPNGVQIHSKNLFGDGTHPMPLPTPFEFAKNQNITADFTDLGGAVGTANVVNGSPNITWNAGALFNTAAVPGPPFPGTPMWNGAVINLNGVLYVVSSAAGSGVTSQTTLTLATNYLGATAAVAYSVSNTIRVAFKGVELAA